MRSKTYEVNQVYEFGLLRTFRLRRNTILRHGFAVPPPFKRRLCPRGGDGGALYKYKENAPKWDVFIHLMEMRAECALFLFFLRKQGVSFAEEQRQGGGGGQNVGNRLGHVNSHNIFRDHRQDDCQRDQ